MIIKVCVIEEMKQIFFFFLCLRNVQCWVLLILVKGFCTLVAFSLCVYIKYV
jgi:hypothetical protein